MKRIISSILVLAMLLTLAPAVLAADVFKVQFDKTAYDVEVGGKLTIPVYISNADETAAKLMVAQVNVEIPDGFSAVAQKGIAAKANVNGKYAKFFKGVEDVEDAYECGKGTAFGTVVLTAPTTPGVYNLNIKDTELFDALGGEYVGTGITEIGATITVKAVETKTLTGITVKPEKIDNIPYDLKDDETGKAAYVKGKIESVIANYSNGDTEAVTEYDVVTSGGVATVTYEGQRATIALSFAAAPSTDKFAVQFDKTAYEVEAGGVLTIPVYISNYDGTAAKLMVAQVNVEIPDGFSAVAQKGIAAKANVNGKYAKFFKGVEDVEDAYECGKDTAFGTVVLTAPTTPGVYNLNIKDTELFDTLGGEYVGTGITEIGATITVTGGSTPSEPTLTGISVNPDEVMVPYNQDVTQVIGTTNFSVTAFYDDETSKVLDRLEYDIKISDDGNTATVSYQGKTATINIKYQPTPVLTVEKSEITVPYGTEDVEAYVKAEIKSGKVKLDETDLTFDDYVIEFTNGADTATVKYADDATITATVNVTYVTLTGVTAELNEGVTEIVLPWSIPDGNEAEAIKSYIIVKGQLSDGNPTAALENADYNVVYDAEKGEFYVTYGGFQSNVLKATKASEPAAEVTGITVNKESVNVPYGKTDEQIIDIVKGGVVVTATYDKGEPSDIAADAYDVTIADDKATITYEGFTADVTLVKETRKLELSKTEITVDEGTDKDGITAYVKANVTAKYVYSQTTAEQTIPVDELAITVNDELTEVTVEVGGESAKIAVNIKVVPNFIETVKADTNAYGIATAKLVIFTDVKDGKVVKVTDEKGTYDAIYMGNGKWAAVVTGSYTAFADNGSLPEAAKFGRLHDASMITAYDALLTLLKANNGAVNVFDNDYQKYLLADVDGNGTLTADEALYINRISLGNADESTLWFNK